MLEFASVKGKMATQNAGSGWKAGVDSEPHRAPGSSSIKMMWLLSTRRLFNIASATEPRSLAWLRPSHNFFYANKVRKALELLRRQALSVKKEQIWIQFALLLNYFEFISTNISLENC
jgi:hypothetical protein